MDVNGETAVTTGNGSRRSVEALKSDDVVTTRLLALPSNKWATFGRAADLPSRLLRTSGFIRLAAPATI